MRECLKLIALLILLPIGLVAGEHDARIRAVLDHHILPGFQHLSEEAEDLSNSAAQCSTDKEGVKAAYHDAFDAWIQVSHLRFGPSETGDRAFALAYWPDSKGFTPKTLTSLLNSADPIVQDPEAFSTLSIAGRGFYALEFLLYDERLSMLGDPAYRCALIAAIAGDIDANVAAIRNDWETGYAASLSQPGGDSPYRSEAEAAQELFKALLTGLEFTAETRLGRPLGTFDRPRPRRAEVWRSERSLSHVRLSLASLRDLAALLAEGYPSTAETLDRAFAKAIDRADTLDDPIFAGVVDPKGRIKVEALQQQVNNIRALAESDLGPRLGVAAGFNSLDGD
ncbi:MAG: peptidase M75 [Rhodobacteraceae bacterium]|nr:peptidase M75 [Paracoccaceae bacterium]